MKVKASNRICLMPLRIKKSFLENLSVVAVQGLLPIVMLLESTFIFSGGFILFTIPGGLELLLFSSIVCNDVSSLLSRRFHCLENINP